MNQSRIYNVSSNNDLKLSGWYKYDNANNAALRLTNSNLKLNGELRFNTTTKQFEGYNGSEWIILDNNKGDKGESGKDFNEIIYFNNLPINLNNVVKKVSDGEIFVNKEINTLNKNENNKCIINVRNIQSDYYTLNDKQHDCISIKQNNSNIILKTNPIPFKQNLTNIDTKNTNKVTTNDDLKCWGDVSLYTLEKGHKVKKGQFIMTCLNNNMLQVKPVSYTINEIPNFYTNPINVIGVSLQDVDTTNQEKEINICTRGITSVLVSNKGDYLSTNGNVDKNGLFGIINYEGRIVKTNRKPIDNYICGGQFIETGSINEDKYFLFNVQINNVFD